MPSRMPALAELAAEIRTEKNGDKGSPLIALKAAAQPDIGSAVRPRSTQRSAKRRPLGPYNRVE